MLYTQEFLRKNGLEKFKEARPDIKIKEYEDRYVFNYNQIESPKFDNITCECRGLILDTDFNIMCRSFDRFFNYGEGNEHIDINWSEYNLVEKLDGSLINLYYDNINDKWQYATRGTAFAESCTSIGNTFESICLKIFDPKHHDLILLKDFTYIFELTSPENRVVTPYKEYKLYLTGIRNKYTGTYYNREYFPKNLVNFPKIISDINLDICKKEIEKLNELEEGYIIESIYMDRRIKFKNPSWILLHHLRENGCPSLSRIILLVYNNDYHEYLTYFPEDKQFFDPVISAFDKLKENILFTFKKYNNIISQKEFALAIKDFHFKSVLFSMRNGNDLNSIFSKSTDNFKIKLIKPYIKEN
jgi:hypothetical protein